MNLADADHHHSACLRTDYTASHEQLMRSLAHQGRKLDMMQTLVMNLHYDVKKILEMRGESHSAAQGARVKLKHSFLTDQFRSSDPTDEIRAGWDTVGHLGSGEHLSHSQSSKAFASLDTDLHQAHDAS
jgi:hypothetical protein